MEGAFSFERNMNNRKHEAKIERTQQRLEAGSVAEHFPEVVSIVINMTYNQRSIKSILRTCNFSPSSYAFFRVDCLNKDCVDGGFDLTQLITLMIRNHRSESKGALSCEGNDPSYAHSDIVYEVIIQFTQS